MTMKEMVKWLKDEVTLSGALKITLPDAEYERLINKETKKVYEYYPDAIKHGYCILPNRLFYTPEFRLNRTIQFPDCVLSVTRLEEMKRRNAMIGINDPDFSYDKTFNADIWFGTQMGMDTVMFRTIQWSLWDQLKQFNLVDIKHKWNRLSHSLLILGHDPYCDVWCEVDAKEEPSRLWDDPWVLQWISAKCKLNVAKLIGTFTVQLIGGVTVNTQLYTEEANNDINECKEIWKDMQQADFFETTP